MGKYFEKHGCYRISHSVNDLHHNHPEFREGIETVIHGDVSEYIGITTVISTEFQYRFYADDDKDAVEVEMTKIGNVDGGMDVPRLFRIEREVEHIVANMLRTPSEKLISHTVAEFNRSHGWSITEHEAKIVLMNIAEHVGH